MASCFVLIVSWRNFDQTVHLFTRTEHQSGPTSYQRDNVAESAGKSGQVAFIWNRHTSKFHQQTPIWSRFPPQLHVGVNMFINNFDSPLRTRFHHLKCTQHSTCKGCSSKTFYWWMFYSSWLRLAWTHPLVSLSPSLSFMHGPCTSVIHPGRWKTV